MTSTSKSLTPALAAAALLLAAVATSPAEGRSGEKFEQNRGSHHHTLQGRQPGHQAQKADSGQGVFTDAWVADRPKGFGIQRRKWTPGAR